MRKFLILILLAAVLATAPAAGAAVSAFDDLTLVSESYWNGADGSGGFVSGDAYFSNFYSTDYSYWEGWAYSNTTDITTQGYTNQFSAITGSGVDGSDNYGVAYTMAYYGNTSQVYFGYESGDYAQIADGFFVTNTTYAYYSMLEGDSFSTPFGEDDWFLLTVYGLDGEYNRTETAVEFYLASGGGLLSDWTWLDLTGLGIVYGLEFELTSSDTGDWGMNTPGYFAMDNLTTTAVPVPAAIWLLGSGLIGLAGLRRRRA